MILLLTMKYLIVGDLKVILNISDMFHQFWWSVTCLKWFQKYTEARYALTTTRDAKQPKTIEKGIDQNKPCLVNHN